MYLSSINHYKKETGRSSENSHVLIDASRADFIDKDIIEVIEDFIIHAPLSNITVEMKNSMYKDQGFNRKLFSPHANGRYIRTHEKTIEPDTDI
jgi:hypothetical protein